MARKSVHPARNVWTAEAADEITQRLQMNRNWVSFHITTA